MYYRSTATFGLKMQTSASLWSLKMYDLATVRKIKLYCLRKDSCIWIQCIYITRSIYCKNRQIKYFRTHNSTIYWIQFKWIHVLHCLWVKPSLRPQTVAVVMSIQAWWIEFVYDQESSPHPYHAAAGHQMSPGKNTSDDIV